MKNKSKQAVTFLVMMLWFSTFSFAQDSETRKLDSFNQVKASEGITVYLKKGSNYSARIETDDIDLDYVVTEVSGNTLRIELDRKNNRGYKIKVYITYRELEMIAASSAASIYGENVIEANQMAIHASSASSIELDIKVNDLKLSVSSAADIELTGSAGTVEAGASSAGTIDAYDLKAGQVEAKASSGSDIKVHAVNAIKAHASSGASVRYRGNPEKSNSSSSSGGSVRKTE